MKTVILTILLTLSQIFSFSQGQQGGAGATGNYVSVPAKIEAESYSAMSGVKTENTSDTGGGLDVGWIDNNDWMDYTISVPSAGSYTFNFRIANAYNNPVIDLRTANGTVLNSLAIPITGGWQKWSTASVTVTLPAGNQTLRIYAVAGGFNFNWFEILQNSSPAPVAGPTYTQIPAKIEAENYSAMSGIKTENTSDAGGGLDVGWIDDNDWMDYKINVPAAGAYTFSFRVANAYNNGQIQIRTATGTVLNSLTVPITGGWQTWTTASISATLQAGNQTLRVFALTGGFNLNWFRVDGSGKSPSVINFADLPAKTLGDAPFNLTATSNNTATPVTFTSSNPAVVSVSGSTGVWVATIAGVGSADITASQAASGNYLAATNVVKTEVVQSKKSLPAGQITMAPLPAKTYGDAPFNLTASSTNSEISITYSSSNPAVVSVSNSSGAWLASINATGTANITASQGGSANYLPAASVTQAQTVQPAPVTQGITKIPMNGKNWYQLNNIGDAVGPTQGLQELNDGVLNVDPFNGWGKVLNNYNCIYNFKNLKNVMISRVRIFAGDKASPGQPFSLYARKTFQDSTLLATYDGSQAYLNWIDIVLPSPVSANYLMANVYWNFPNEVELYGTYNTDSTTILYPKKDIRFRDQLGANEAVWDLTQGVVDVTKKDTLDPTRLRLAKAFTQVRDYVEWDKIETTPGTYIFQRTVAEKWNYDAMYKGLKANNIEVLPCLKNIPNWFLQAYYPAGLQDGENVPAPYGTDLLNPNSYILQAKFAFQFAARYGSSQVNMSLLSGVPTGLSDTSARAIMRTRESGMNVIKYVECENERDKWWKGRKSYQTGFEYAANLSAFYDGNKNTMGPGVGVKNADPNMKVVIGGIASTSTDYIRAIIDWCKENRGYKADGTINLCFDVINYHSYANNAGSSQGGQPTRGAAPEVGGSGTFAKDFAQLSREYNVQTWVTETGYDLNQGSTLHAPPIGNKTPEEVEADWIIRTALLGARAYINKTFFYQMYDIAPSSGQTFASSGLLWDAQFNNNVWARKRAADYTMQTQHLIGDYIYKETISNDPTVDRYQLNDTSVYVLAIPDEVGRTANYTLQAGTADSAAIYTLVGGSDYMQMRKVKIVNGQLQVTVTETPVFVKLTGKATTQMVSRTMFTDTTSVKNTGTDIKLFPNPTTNYLNLQIKNDKQQDVEVRIIEAASGIVFKTISLDNHLPYIYQQIDVKSLPQGAFIVQVLKGNQTITRRFLKL